MLDVEVPKRGVILQYSKGRPLLSIAIVYYVPGTCLPRLENFEFARWLLRPGEQECWSY